MTAMEQREGIRRYRRPYNWKSIDRSVHDAGAVVLQDLFPAEEVCRMNTQIDDYLAQNTEAGLPDSGSAGYNRFLGYQTIRFHALLEKFPAAESWICNGGLVSWAERLLEPVATAVLLNAGELIQIGPGEPEQYLHRDTDSWPLAPFARDPILVNAVVALDRFTAENGATRIAPGSWRWERDRKPEPRELVTAEMAAGDALLFRGDLVHGGGANTTARGRRAISISYCAGWLRPVEASLLNVSRERVKHLAPRVQGLLGYAAYDGKRDHGGLVGLYENGDPGCVPWLDDALPTVATGSTSP